MKQARRRLRRRRLVSELLFSFGVCVCAWASLPLRGQIYCSPFLYSKLFSLLLKLFFAFLIWRGFAAAFFLYHHPARGVFGFNFGWWRRAFLACQWVAFLIPAAGVFGFLLRMARAHYTRRAGRVHDGRRMYAGRAVRLRICACARAYARQGAGVCAYARVRVRVLWVCRKHAYMRLSKTWHTH